MNCPDLPASTPETGQTRTARALIRGYGLLLLPLAIYLPGVLAFPFPGADTRFSDLVLSHLPNLLYLRESLLHWGTIPLWSPLIMSGAPFAANPLSGLWYPLGWIPLVLPVPLGFNLAVMLHLLWGGFGLTRYLRSQGLAETPAMFGGMLFMAWPKLAAHYGAGHLTLLYAVPWTPWLLLATEAVLRNGPGRARWTLWRPGLILALIFLADVRWVAYAGALWLGWIVHRRLALRSRFSTFGRAGAWLVSQLGIGGALAACLGLPLLEFVGLSTRGSLSASEILVFSLPPSRLLGLLFPDFGGFVEWSLYAGGPVLVLAGLGVLLRRDAGRTSFWIWTASFSLAFALGENLPGLELVARLPGLSLLRVPPRALFLLALALASLAAEGLQILHDGISAEERRRLGLWLVGLSGFSLAITAGVVVLTGIWAPAFLWGTGAVLAGSLGVAGKKLLRSMPAAWAGGMALICLVDLGASGLSLYAPRAASRVWAEDQAVAEAVSGDRDLYRVYSPSYSLAQHMAAEYGLSLADGVDPLQLSSYAAYFEAASGVPIDGYAVTLPPLPGDDPSSANAGATPDPDLLGRLNVRYLAAEFPVAHEDLELETRVSGTYVYRNLAFRPRAWVEDPADPSTNWRPAEAVSWSPNVIQVTARGPGRLVLSELAYPGWQARVDGEPAELSSDALPFRAVELPAGTHRIDFLFRPGSVGLGLAISLGTLVLLLVWSLRAGRG